MNFDDLIPGARRQRYRKAAVTDETGRPLHNREILLALGLRPGHRLPDNGTGIVTIGHLKVRVAPKGQGLSKSNKAHRTLAECPHCGNWFCAGHILQHTIACDAT